MEPQFFRPGSLARFGAFGDILQDGYCRGREGGLLELRRTGPFVPPISFPGMYPAVIVVTDEFRRRIEESPLELHEFRPVVKNHIATLRWEQWNQSADEPEEYPPTDEIESYIEARPHDPATAEAMGPLWEIVLRNGAMVDTHSIRKAWDYDVRVHIDTWTGRHVFYGHEPPGRGPWLLVDRLAYDWLTDQVGEWLEFRPCLQR